MESMDPVEELALSASPIFFGYLFGSASFIGALYLLSAGEKEKDRKKKAEWKVRFLSFIALVAIIEIGTLDIDTSENFVVGANISQFFGILGTIAGFYRHQNARKNSRKSGRDRDSEE